MLHQRLLQGLAGIQQVPARCRQAEHWAELVRHSPLDGALLSSFCLERRLLSGQLPHWEGLVVLPISPELLATNWLERHGLQPLVDQPLLVEHLWLLLPQGAASGSAAREALRALRQQLHLAETMQHLHKNQY